MTSIALTSAVVVITLPFAFRYRTADVTKTVEWENGTIVNITEADVELRELWRVEWLVNSYNWTINIVFYMLPLLLLFVMNSLIIRELWRTRQHHRKFPARRRITIMLVTVTLVFMACIAPDAVMSTVFGLGYTEANYLVKGVREITDLFVTVNSAVDFLLYCSFHEAFRQHFTGVLTSCTCARLIAKRRPPIVETIANQDANTAYFAYQPTNQDSPHLQSKKEKKKSTNKHERLRMYDTIISTKLEQQQTPLL